MDVIAVNDERDGMAALEEKYIPRYRWQAHEVGWRNLRADNSVILQATRTPRGEDYERGETRGY